jgi:hypothetical protein
MLRTDLAPVLPFLFLVLPVFCATSPISAALIRSDFDRNGTVAFADFLILIEVFGDIATSPDFDTRTDLDGDGLIAFNDFLIFVEDFGQTTGDVGNDVGNGLEVVHGPDAPDETNNADRDNPFRSLTPHPLDADIVLLGTERNGFVKTVDGGQTWTRHRLGLRHTPSGYPEVWDIAYDPEDPSIVYAATLDSPGPVTGDFPSSSGGVYRSDDGGDTWSRKNCGLTSSRITSVAVLGEDTSVVVIGVEGGTASFDSLKDVFFQVGCINPGIRAKPGNVRPVRVMIRQTVTCT